MKVLISHEGPVHAHFYERISLSRAFQACGLETVFWNMEALSCFDLFDSFVPNLIITQAYNINPSLIQCVKENPNVHIWAKCGDWGPLADRYDLSKYEILVADDKQKQNIIELASVCNNPIYVGAHYLESRAEDTHGYWKQLGCIPLHMRMAADIFEFYQPKVIDELKCDISFLGNYWPYKGKNFQKFLFQFLTPDSPYNVKIFGMNWGVPQYAGHLPSEYVSSLFHSSTINFNFSEPHANGNGENPDEYGVESCERIYKVLTSKGFLISDYNRDLAENIFNDGEMIWCKTPQEVKKMTEHFIKNKEERLEYIDAGYKKIIKSETYFHRISHLLNTLNRHNENKLVLESYEKVKKELSL